MYTADRLLENGNVDFVINDGARGFSSCYLNAKNFNSYVYQAGVFERHRTDIPQINLIHVHGSIFWQRCPVSRYRYANNMGRSSVS